LEKQLMKKIAALTEVKHVELFLFGTPLCLTEIPKYQKFQKIVCAYQDFEVTQRETARYFLG
jgi:beta-N-acetylhexosaminidase